MKWPGAVMRIRTTRRVARSIVSWNQNGGRDAAKVTGIRQGDLDLVRGLPEQPRAAHVVLPREEAAGVEGVAERLVRPAARARLPAALRARGRRPGRRRGRMPSWERRGRP